MREVLGDAHASPLEPDEESIRSLPRSAVGAQRDAMHTGAGKGRSMSQRDYNKVYTCGPVILQIMQDGQQRLAKSKSQHHDMRTSACRIAVATRSMWVFQLPILVFHGGG